MNKQLIAIVLLFLIGFVSSQNSTNTTTTTTTSTYKCVDGTNGCSSCDATKKACSTCKVGWYLDATSKQCKQCNTSQGCLACSDAAKCTQAAPSYTLVSDAPVKCQDGCAVCTKSATTTDVVCGTAAAGFYLAAAQAPATGFIPTACATGCNQCKDATIAGCQIAKQGFFFDVGLGKCVDKNCLKCRDNKASCTDCKSGFIIQGTTTKTCDACIANCASCTNKTECVTCKSAFTYDSTKKTCNACSVANCVNCDGDAASCVTCASGYSFITPSCIKCADFCNSCTVAGECASSGCQQGYSFNAQTKTCGKTCSDKCTQGCSQKGFGGCDQCDTGYGWKNISGPDYSCGSCSANCLSCHLTNGANKCDSCQSNYGLISTDGSTKNTCAACGTGCTACAVTVVAGSNVADCTTCSAGYATGTLNNVRSCVSCTATQKFNSLDTTGFDTKALKCTFNVPPAVVVTECVTGFYLYNGKCYSCQAAATVPVGNTPTSLTSVQFQAQSSACSFQFVHITACKAGFVLFNNKCVNCKATNTGFDANATTCTTTDGSTVKVTACADFYALYNGACVSCSTATGGSANAKTCTATSATAVQIDTCKDGYAYWATTKACVSCTATSTGADANAKACTATSASAVTITSCKSQYTLYNSACTSCVATTAKADANALECTITAPGGTATVTAISKCADGFINGLNGANEPVCFSCTSTSGGFDAKASACTFSSWDGSKGVIAVTACSNDGTDFYGLKSADKTCKLCNKTTSGFDANAIECTVADVGGTDTVTVTKCKTGYSIFNNKCVSCTATSTGSHANASACNATGASAVTVTECAEGYALFEAACSSCIATNTGFDTNTKTCDWKPVAIHSTCNSGYTLKYNLCVSCSSTQSIWGNNSTGAVSNCSACSVTGLAITCSACATGYTLSGGSCVQCDTNCTLNNKCKDNGAGKCDTGNCASGYGITSTTNFTCSPCAPNCNTCSSLGAGLCDDQGCKPTFYNTSTGNLCAQCAPNCTSCTVGNQCDICKQGYYKSGTSCAECYSTKYCGSCTSATLIDCTPIDEWGKYFVGSTLTAANSAITVISACVANCALCFGPTATDCIEALPKFYFDGTTIVACVAGCDVCTGATADKCTQVSTGFYSNKVNGTTTITACPTGCAACSLSGTNVTCSACPNDLGGSIKDVNITTTFTCTYNCISNCDKCTTQDTTGCTACKTGFSKDSKGACVSSTAANNTNTTSDTGANILSALFIALMISFIILF